MNIKNRVVKNKLLRKYLFCLMKGIYFTSSSLGFKIYNTKIKKIKPRKIYSDLYKFVYIENPLSASQSIIKSIYEDKNNIYKSKSCRDWNEVFESKRNINEYAIFTIKRNPWERIVSCYNKKVMNACSPARMAILAQYSGLYPQMSFGEFVDWLCSKEGSDENSDKHWTSQSKIIYEMNPVRPDFIVEINNLEKEINSIFESIDAPPPNIRKQGESVEQYISPIFNRSKEYFMSLDEEQIVNIEKRYKKDCEILGYDYLREWL